MGADFSCFGGSGRLYRFDHSGTAKATASKIYEGVDSKGGFESWTCATVCGSPNNDITDLARASFVKLSGLITDQTPFRLRGSSGQATEASIKFKQACSGL
jgi:hypothetical protein